MILLLLLFSYFSHGYTYELTDLEYTYNYEYIYENFNKTIAHVDAHAGYETELKDIYTRLFNSKEIRCIFLFPLYTYRDPFINKEERFDVYEWFFFEDYYEALISNNTLMNYAPFKKLIKSLNVLTLYAQGILHHDGVFTKIVRYKVKTLYAPRTFNVVGTSVTEHSIYTTIIWNQQRYNGDMYLLVSSYMQ